MVTTFNNMHTIINTSNAFELMHLKRKQRKQPTGGRNYEKSG